MAQEAFATSPDEQRQLEQIEAEYEKRVEQAREVFKRNPDYPSVVVQFQEQCREIDQTVSAEANERLSPARLNHLMKYVDVRGKTYLDLITDLQSVEAFEVLMVNFSRETWWQFSMVPIESIPPTVPFSNALPIQLQRDTLRSRERDWVVEAYKRLASLNQRPSEPSGRDSTSHESSHQSIARRGLDHFADAERRAQAQIHYEERLEQSRKQREVVAAGLNRAYPTKHETIAEQIERLRDECGLSIEELAEKMDIHPTNVARHVHNESVPTRKNLAKYKRVFSTLLKRDVVISKTQPKRS